MEIDNYILYICGKDGSSSFMSDAVSRLNPSVKVKYEYTDDRNGIAYLAETIRNNATLPLLIVIDLDMTAINGKEILYHIRTIKGLNKVPVVFLTNTSEELQESFLAEHRVTTFLKPHNIKEYNSIAETIVYSMI